MGVQKATSPVAKSSEDGTRRVTRSMSVFHKGWPEHLLDISPPTYGKAVCTPSGPLKPSPSPRRRSTGKISHFHKEPWAKRKRSIGPDIKLEPKAVLEVAPRQPGKPRSDDNFGLIQESISHNLYALVVQAILWNQTAGKQARPVLEQLLNEYPDPAALASAKFEDLAAMLYPIGLYNNRAKRLIDMATKWLEQPPVPGRGYAKVRDRKYTDLPLCELETESKDGDGVKIELSEELAASGLVTDAKFWEVAHLPGVGPYALDSFRIFHRDEMRGLSEDWLGSGAKPGMTPEWKRVVPTDKELRAYLKWLWAKEGWDWDWETGNRKVMKRTVTKSK